MKTFFKQLFCAHNYIMGNKTGKPIFWGINPWMKWFFDRSYDKNEEGKILQIAYGKVYAGAVHYCDKCNKHTGFCHIYDGDEISDEEIIRGRINGTA